MILKKVFYRPIFYPVSLIKSFLLVFTQTWKNFSSSKELSSWEKAEDYQNQHLRGRPRLTERSRVIAGDWKATQEICPTRCLQVQVQEGKLLSMWLDRERCIHCALCVQVAPKGGLETIPSWEESTPQKLENIDLVKERA